MPLNNKDHVPITSAFLNAQHHLGIWLVSSILNGGVSTGLFHPKLCFLSPRTILKKEDVNCGGNFVGGCESYFKLVILGRWQVRILYFRTLYVISPQQITYMLSVLCPLSIKQCARHQWEHREEKRYKKHVSLRCVIWVMKMKQRIEVLASALSVWILQNT